jgi:hypothetical protein
VFNRFICLYLQSHISECFTPVVSHQREKLPCCHSSISAATTFTWATNRQASQPPLLSPTPCCGMQLCLSHRCCRCDQVTLLPETTQDSE